MPKRSAHTQRRGSAHRLNLAFVLLAASPLAAQTTPPAPEPPAAAQTATTAGGTIHGTVTTGSGKSATPLPGVAVTATNTLTGKKYATTTDIAGAFAMTIPRTGRYVVRAELAAFAPITQEVRITAEASTQTASFALELASRAAAQSQEQATATTRALANALGTQSLSVSGGEASDATDTTVAGGNAGASLPSLAGLGDTSNPADSVTVSGAQGSTNGLAGINEDDLRQRIDDAVAQARQRGGADADQMNAVVGMLGGLIGGGGFGGPGGPGGGGGGRGGRGGGGGGGGFRNFNPTQPHGAIFYQGGFPALQAQQSSTTSLLALENGGLPQTPQPFLGSQQNRFGVSFTGSPSIPGLYKANPKQFVFINVTGVRNITPVNFTSTVPTLAERGQTLVNGTPTNSDADLSALAQTVSGTQITPPIYNPATAQRFAGNIIPAALITPQARALLNYYPLPNIVGASTQNYQTITTQGTNTTQGSARFVRNFGAQGGGPFGGGGGGGRRGGGANANAPKSLRQTLNLTFSFSRNAADVRNFIPILGGKSDTSGYGLSTGYTVSYGRLSNNASLNWNRSSSETVNFFTGSSINPATAAGIAVPSQAAGLAQPGFYNGVPNISLTNFSPLTETTPVSRINQTISFSDFVAYRHGKHNMRLGTDIRRVHVDQVGGNNPLGSFVFSGLVTESPTDQAATLQNTTGSTKPASSGASLADLLLGQPQETKIQAGLFKTYLRANILDGYAQDDFRLSRGLTLNYGLRYEYFSPYVEKNNRLVNLDHNANFTSVDAVTPNSSGTFSGKYPRSLVNPDRTMFSPRFGLAWRPKFLKETVIRTGYGINYNTGQFATFAQSLAFQPPFATTQNNTLSTAANNTGCFITTPGAPTNLTLANGFNCSTKAIQNTYAVDKNYRLGHVQIYNLDIQKSLPHGVVVNLGYNGSKGGNLDIVTAPNATATFVTTPGAQAFTYETSLAASRLQQLVISARKRLEKGVSLQLLYQYGHSIDNASSIGGGSVSTVQNSQRIDLEEGNSSFDVRHKLTGNYVLELPFGPNRAFLASGGTLSKVFDGFSLSGDFTFASGTYFTPQYQNSAAQLAAGGTYTLRPDRVPGQPIAGKKTIGSWFNPAAFTAPANGFGTASRNSIEGPGTVASDLSLSRTFSFGGTRSFETRLTGTNIFNTVQYKGISTVENSAQFGQVTSTATQRVVTLIARYRF